MLRFKRSGFRDYDVLDGCVKGSLGLSPIKCFTRKGLTNMPVWSDQLLVPVPVQSICSHLAISSKTIYPCHRSLSKLLNYDILFAPSTPLVTCLSHTLGTLLRKAQNLNGFLKWGFPRNSRTLIKRTPK